MAIRTQPPTTVDPEGDLAGHTYRLSDDQFRRAVDAGIIPGSTVELRDGFLRRKPGPRNADLEEHYRLSVAQYRAMSDLEILTTEDRSELLEGWLVAKMSKKPPHTISKGATLRFFIRLVPLGWYVAVEDPVTAVDSEPEPDLSIVRGDVRDYREEAPGPAHVALIVEVADSSLGIDRSIKKRLYTRSGFPLYWLINRVDHRIEVYSQPTGQIEEPDYLRREDLGPDDMIPLVIDGQEVARIAVRDLLP